MANPLRQIFASRNSDPESQESRNSIGEVRASPVIPEIQKIGKQLAAKRNADLFEDPTFTWLD
ncbi:hypothetical protein [Candidatus Poriferisocius sp.]|uniref:hypothetical protein n=1 Tax=Candidatus Poriferisocius sp. TaxID=3101276 RepID=UPI003B0181AF